MDTGGLEKNDRESAKLT